MKILLALLILGIAAESVLLAAVCWRANEKRELSASDCIIVLGARVWPDGEMSNALKYRVDAALDAYNEGYAGYIIVCGAQGADEPRTEAEAMAEYLIESGVPAHRVFLDDESYDTHQNIANAAEIMRENGWTTAIVATTDYHVERSLWIAGDAGLDACGIAAKSPQTIRSYWKGRVRETASWVFYWLGWA